MDFAFNLVGKLVWLVVQPQNWIALGLILAVLFALKGQMRPARRSLFATAALFAALSILPLGDLALASLEDRYPIPTRLDPVEGIIVLGGAEDAALSYATGQPQLGAAGDRIVVGAALAQAQPQARLIHTGGGGLTARDYARSEATVAADIYTAMGIAFDRLVLEYVARNTTENARLTAQLVDPTKPYILVTSAFHMPRALGSFQRAGWTNLTAYPVDYQAQAPRLGWDFIGQTQRLTIALREYLGLLAYAVTGR